MTPRISAIVWLGGADDDVAACLQSLHDAMVGAPASEILLAGVRSSDGVPERFGVRRVAEEEGDVAIGWNLGAAAATGDILLFLRADTVSSPELLSAHLALHAGGDPAIGVTQVVPATGSHPLASVRRPLEPGADVPGEPAGQAFSVPASAFRRVGGFTAGLAGGQEVDLAHRLRLLGLDRRLIAGAVCRTAKPVTAARAIAERVAAGQGSVALYRRTPALLPQLELGGYHAGNPPALWLRRALLALGGPPLPPALGALLPRGRWRERWLRFQHDYHFWRGVRGALGPGALWQALVRPPVILMYHAVGAPGEAPGCYIVPLRRFQRQMAWLTLRRYRVIGLEELLDHRRAHEVPPARTVVLTFDDGYDDNYSLATPVLRARGFKAMFFLVSGYVGRRNSWDPSGELAGRPLLSWEDARAMLALGMEVGAHTRSHPVLPDLPKDRATHEIAGARQELEAAIGRPVRAFAYPFGRLDESTPAAVADGGFEGACCSRSGVNDPSVSSLLLRRLEVRGTDSLLQFAIGVHRGRAFRRRRF
jgi:peptidoglycan/xylan/chitin deacetylase (PgdA/CDA1 family)